MFWPVAPFLITLWNLVSDLLPGSDTICASLRLLLCYILDTSFRLTSHCRTIFSAFQPHSTTRFLVTCRCMSVSLRWSFSAAKLGLAPATLIPSAPHTRAVLPVSSSRSSWLCLRSIFFTSCVQTTLMSTTTFAKNSKAYQCGHLIPKSQVSHTTAPASPRTSLQVCTSNICFLQAFCCSLHHLPNQTPSSQESVGMVESSSSTSNLFNSIKSESEPNSFFPAGAALCLLNFRLSAGAMPTACSSTTSSNQSS